MAEKQTYPKRPKFFAHRITRLVFKTCLAQQTSPAAALLVIVVAHTEDAKHYAAPPTFYNEQLMPILGIRKWDTLVRARNEAIAAGWLHYETGPSGSRKPGTYWTVIPESLSGVDDLPTDEDFDRTQESDTLRNKAYPRNGDGLGDLPTLSRSLTRNRESSPKPPGGFPFVLPAAWNLPEVRSQLDHWFRHVESSPKGHPVPDWDLAANQALQFFSTPEELCKSVATGISNGYVTLKNYHDGTKSRAKAERAAKKEEPFDDGLPVLRSKSKKENAA
jgi:hypothetical protein